MNIIPINEEDNVGDGLAKINYNFVKLNQDACELLESRQDNFSSLKKIEDLMLWLDDVISYTDYDKLQKLETTIQMLSSYWNKYEFTVQYPFNPSNGFTSSLVNAGEFGGLSSFNLSTTNQADQENLIGEVLVKQGFYETVNLSIKGLKDRELLYVYRDTNGVFVKWDILDPSFIFNISVDLANNLYYNGTLIDIYQIPYYSAITKNENFGLFEEEVFANFSTKRISIKGTIQPLDKTSLNNLLVVYDDYQRIEEEIAEDEKGDEVNLEFDVTTFTPEIINLSSIIPQKNILYKDKISRINDSVLESAESNPRLNRLCLNFLDKNYPAKNYFDGTVVNVVFFLYNLIGYNTNATSLVRTDYYDQADISTPKNKLELFNTKELSLIAPSSNTTFTVYFSKKDSYIEKIVNVKYIKNTDTVQTTDKVTGKVTTVENHYWEFKNAILGAPFTKQLDTKSDLELAPTFFTELKEFGTAPAPAPATNTNEYGNEMTKEEREKDKKKKKKEKEREKEKNKKQKEKEQRENKKEKNKQKKEKEKERRENKKQKEKEQRENKKEKADQKKQKQKDKDKENNSNRKNNENNRKKEKTNVDNQVKKKDNQRQKDKDRQNKVDGVKNNKKGENENRQQQQNRNKQENNKKQEKQNKQQQQNKDNQDKQNKTAKAKQNKEDEDNRQREKQRNNDAEKKKSEEQRRKEQQQRDDDAKKKKQQDDDNKKKQNAQDNKGTKQGNNVETRQQKKNEQAKQQHQAAKSGGGGDGGGPKKKK